MADAARAFWIAAPGRGEIREESLPTASDEDVLVRTSVQRDQPWNRSAGVSGPRPGERVPAHAGAVPGREFSGADQVRLLERRADRARSARPAGPHGVRAVSASDPVCRTGAGRPRAARRRAARARCTDGQPRNGDQRIVGRAAARRGSDRGRRRRDGRLSRRVAGGPDAGLRRGARRCQPAARGHRSCVRRSLRHAGHHLGRRGRGDSRERLARGARAGAQGGRVRSAASSR